MNTPDVISPTDYEVSSQFAHFFTAAFLVTALGHFCGHIGIILGAVGMTAWAAIKEFWYDVKHENPLVRGSSPLDFAMYMAGNVIAVALWFVKP